MNRIRTSALLLAIAIGPGEAALAAPAAEPAWNAKEVITLAENLVRVLDEAAAAAREAPPQATVLQQRTRDDALNSFDQVRQAAGDYVAKLRKGWDRDMTESYFRNIQRLFQDARTSGRDAIPTQKVDRKLRETDAILEKLSRFYPNV